MSTINHPVGRQSSKVYRRRRFVVGFGLLAVLVIIFLIVVKPGASSGDAKPKVPAASAAATDTPTDAATTIPEQAAAVDGAACDPTAVEVEAITDTTTYAAGVLPELSLSLTNIGTTNCVLNAGNAKQVFTVTSGQDTYWTSTDCQTDPVDAEVTLKPGVPMNTATPITWDRTRSATDTCDAKTRDAVPAGGASYFLNVTVDGIAAASPKQLLLY